MNPEALATVLIKSANTAITANRIKYYLATDFIHVISTYCKTGKTAMYFCKCPACVTTIHKLRLEIAKQYDLDETLI